jgi:hypothetical protein
VRDKYVKPSIAGEVFKLPLGRSGPTADFQSLVDFLSTNKARDRIAVKRE